VSWLYCYWRSSCCWNFWYIWKDERPACRLSNMEQSL